MAKKAELKIYNDYNYENTWELEQELSLETLWDLQEGENPQQKAGVFKSEHMADYEVFSGKTLTYSEVISLTELANILSEFYDVFAVAIIKDELLCGIALAPTLEEAYNKAFDCDPLASFYGIIGCSDTINAELAKHLNSMSVQLIMAPDFEADAIEILEKNSDIKVVKLNTPLKNIKKLPQKEIRVTPFGTIWQEENSINLAAGNFEIVTKTKPTKEQVEDAVFAWKVSKHAHSNSVVIAKDFKTVAISQGETSSVTAVEHAMTAACDASKEAILVSDMVLPTIDAIHTAVQGRIALIVQPGGSPNDEKLIEAADKYGIAMAFTGIKNYKR